MESISTGAQSLSKMSCSSPVVWLKSKLHSEVRPHYKMAPTCVDQINDTAKFDECNALPKPAY